MSRKNQCIGEISYNNYGTPMRIISYTDNKNVLIEFMDEFHHRKKCYYLDFKKGLVSNPYDKTVCSIGYMGEIKPKEHMKTYNVWKGMIERCYSPKRTVTNQSYNDCKVCEDWHCFAKFCAWYERNYYEVNNEKMCLDKDILVKNNKIYSPDTCLIVPYKINMLFVKRKGCRGKSPIGTSYDPKRELYGVSRNYIVGKTHYLGRFADSFDAFETYKTYKEKHIKEIADEYKHMIPQKVYEAMYKYEVDIND